MKVALKPAVVPTPLVLANKKPSADERASGAAATAARAKTRAILNYQQASPLRSWDELEMRFSVPVPLSFKSQPISFLAVQAFCRAYEKDFVAKVEAADERKLISTAPTRRHFPPGEEITIGAWTLRPRQRKARWQILHQLIETEETDACYVTMNTGSGKTQVAAAVIRAFQDNDYFGRGNKFHMWNIVYVTPKAVQIKTARALAKAGIRNIGTDVQIIPYTSFRTKAYKNLFEEVEVVDQFNGQKKKEFRFRLGKPALLILDEAHKIKKRESTMTRYIRAFNNGHTKVVLMSATPAIVLGDLEFFALASRKHYIDGPLTELTWPVLCSEVGRAARGEINAAAMERVFKWFGDAIVNPPADPRRAKAHNGVKLIDFPDEASKARYHRAQEAYLETCRRVGKDVSGQGEILTAFTNFRRAAEAESVPRVADLMMEAHSRGRAPVCAVAYRQTVKLLVAELARRGVTRDKISIIQGGEAEIREEDIFPMFEWIKLRQKMIERDWNWEGDTKLRAKFNKSERYHKERLKSERTVDEQRDLDKWLAGMRLYNQTPEQRQDEIDNFQEGRTEFCIFTLSAGGTGIDLDQQIPAARPREMFAMLCYYAEEFVQAFGRCYREFTLSDVWQWAIAFRGTIVTEHVVPRLVGKLATINRSAGAGLNIESALTEAATKGALDRGEVAELEAEVTDDVVDIEEEDEEDEEENGKE